MVLQVMLAIDGQIVLQGVDWVLSLLVCLGTLVALALIQLLLSATIAHA